MIYYSLKESITFQDIPRPCVTFRLYNGNIP